MRSDHAPPLALGTSEDSDIPALFCTWFQRLAIAAMRSSNISVRITSGSFAIPTSRTYFAAMPWPVAGFAGERRTSTTRRATPALMTRPSMVTPSLQRVVEQLCLGILTGTLHQFGRESWPSGVKRRSEARHRVSVLGHFGIANAFSS